MMIKHDAQFSSLLAERLGKPQVPKTFTVDLRIHLELINLWFGQKCVYNNKKMFILGVMFGICALKVALMYTSLFYMCWIELVSHLLLCYGSYSPKDKVLTHNIIVVL